MQADSGQGGQQSLLTRSLDIPPGVMGISPVPSYPANKSRGTGGIGLPLNIIALIVSYLDDLGDIARVTRTSRLLYYMTLPQLYQRVSITSYPEIRYKDGRPEGYGGGSAFCVALGALATSSASAFVKDFRLAGSWKETAIEQYNLGRVPDGSMLLDIVIRAAIDKMVNMETFTWELDTKPLKTMYQGLALRNSLTSLSLVFPTSRTPRPTVLVPPIPNLKALRISNLDPLCSQDDISLLLLGSKKLEDLRLHWNPRMRKHAEPSINLSTLFGRSIAAKYKLKLKHMAMQNFYGANRGEFAEVFDPSTLVAADFLDVFGGTTGAASNVYIDDTWKDIPNSFRMVWKHHRSNEPAAQHVKILQQFTGLEYFYLVSAPSNPRNPSAASAADGLSPGTVAISPLTPFASPGKPPSHNLASNGLGNDYLQALTTNHGSTLRHLLLSDQWALTSEQIGHLVRSCPNLEQLGLALDRDTHEFLKILIPFLPKLTALRILTNDSLLKAMEEEESKGKSEDLDSISHDLTKTGVRKLRWICWADRVLKVGGVYQAVDENGNPEWRRHVEWATLDDVKDVEIWKLDSLDIMQT